MNKTEPNPAAPAPTLTHQGGRGFRGADGVLRHVYLSRWSEGSFQLTFETFWDGDEAEPLLTEVRLGPEAFDLLASFLVEFHLDLDRFAIPRAEVAS